MAYRVIVVSYSPSYSYPHTILSPSHPFFHFSVPFVVLISIDIAKKPRTKPMHFLHLSRPAISLYVKIAYFRFLGYLMRTN
mmetsp:Transcript_7041/g.18072  ORF Transcript_7041/g.18072 Transcript_7041/m.18072 type:complete len:81 (+) Transcript_7041:226-468(+)